MEIAPIPGIRFMPIAPRPLVAGVNAPIFDIDDLARIGGDSYSARHEESKGGMQNEYDEMLGEDDDYEEPLYSPAARRPVGRRLNCFA